MRLSTTLICEASQSEMCWFAGGYQVWKKSFFFAAIPIIILGHVNAFGMADESAHTPPEFVPYDHLRIRSKVPLVLNLEHKERNICIT